MSFFSKVTDKHWREIYNDRTHPIFFSRGQSLAVHTVQNKIKTLPWSHKDNPYLQRMLVEISMGQCNNIKI